MLNSLHPSVNAKRGRGIEEEKRLAEEAGLLVCPHCYNTGKFIAFATYHDLRYHVKRGCVVYRYRRD